MNGRTNMTYFFHSKCGNNIYLDATPIFKIITSFGIGKTSLKIKSGQILQLGESEKTTFYCPNCKEQFTDTKLILVTCMYCGKNVPATESISPSTSGGIYCTEHGTRDKFPGEILRNLSDICAKMTIK